MINPRWVNRQRLDEECRIKKILPSYIEDKIMPVTESGCWIWMAGISKSGYSKIKFHRRTYRAHRLIYELLKQTIPSNLTLDHLCKVKECVNPDHLEIVTHRINTLRSNNLCAINARKTHCLRGHPLSGDNLHIYKGLRVCRTCKRITNNEIKIRKQTNNQ